MFVFNKRALSSLGGIFLCVGLPTAALGVPNNGAPFLDLQRQIDELRAQIGGGTVGDLIEVDVDCATQSINDVITGSPVGGRLVITVNGNCNENLVVNRSRTTLKAGSGGGTITGQANDGAAVSMPGTRDVLIDGLTLTQAAGVEGDGVYADRNADVRIENATIVGNRYGVWARFGAYLRLVNNDISRGPGTTPNGAYGMLLSDTATARLDNNRITIATSSRSDEAAIGAFRDIAMRLRGNNVIRNNGDDDDPGTTGDNGVSVSFFHGTTLRQDGGHSSVSGDVDVGNVSNVAFRNVDISGNVNVFGTSTLQLRDQSREPSGSTSTNVTVTGHIELGGASLLNIGRNVILDAGINGESASQLNVGRNTEINGAVRMATNAHIFLSRETVINGPLEFIRSSYLDTEFVVGSLFDGPTINGPVTFNDSSTLNLGGGKATINGDVNFFGRSALFIGDETESKFVTINGNVFFLGIAGSAFNGNATAAFGDGTTTVNGDVDCNNGEFSGTPTVTGVISNCL